VPIPTGWLSSGLPPWATSAVGCTNPNVVLKPQDGDAPELLLQRVPEPKVAKNRMHLDMRIVDLGAEAARLEGLGARRLGDEIEEDGFRWFVMADPEGNEFCVCQEPPGTRPD
jgi:predicted enzyme related to lactoylglutathione lyase